MCGDLTDLAGPETLQCWRPAEDPVDHGEGMGSGAGPQEGSCDTHLSPCEAGKQNSESCFFKAWARQMISQHDSYILNSLI